ncbi:MAG TPA: phosphoribosylanthranilate isomerase [bacterium]|nr:phosphoribosylanthranilate isomerase [bacterium]
MFRVKICGVTRPRDVRQAVKAGADAIGFQMTMGPRKITPTQAKRLVRGVPPTVVPVGVFVNEPLAKVKRLIKLCGFQAVQLHGEESEVYFGKISVPVIKVIRMKNKDAYKRFRGFRVAAFLLDSYNKNIPGGTGQSYPYPWARKAVLDLPAPVLIAGGLTPENVQKALRSSHAFGADVSSGVEARPGIKDPRKVSLFVQRVRKVFQP